MNDNWISTRECVLITGSPGDGSRGLRCSLRSWQRANGSLWSAMIAPTDLLTVTFTGLAGRS